MRGEGYKRCTGCGETKPIDEFNRHGTARRARCKACTRQESREWRQKNPEKVREDTRRKYARNPDASKVRMARWRAEKPEIAKLHDGARMAVFEAVRAGQLVRPETCGACGGPGPIEGHHPDYTKPLNVEWLCRLCHGAAHAKPTN